MAVLKGGTLTKEDLENCWKHIKENWGKPDVKLKCATNDCDNETIPGMPRCFVCELAERVNNG